MQRNLNNFDKSIIIPFSTIDWHGKVAMVVFLRGCNMRCLYCQNYLLWEDNMQVNVDNILFEIRKSKDFIDAVIFSGGEPTKNLDLLITVATEVKKTGLLVGVETNGTLPDRILNLINSALLDGLFIDVKAPLSSPQKYSAVAGVKISQELLENIRKSIESGYSALMSRELSELEIRTTVFKEIPKERDIIEIAQEFKHISYVLQQGRSEYSKNANLQTMSRKELVAIAESCGRAIRIRTKESGEELISRR
ncbi:MAG TPA: anaerobic ribonucleoside-triphosphate reductase activating protein [Candidatus Acidoferrum sp.]|nr:anaerobic ribonucleoside-triphosphate reductase activating protein [Candidatus Acidoferrum sp.]